ncbi:hypothetical protein HHSLTHF2_18020 [Vreelandella venusta]|uniref:Uracil-DNA glycosylase-like domain-containing protein n=1 Tax=Halomonas hydrothermalis TaxID=115561 RepID=A0A6F8U376_9GAMM|nr:hypothetical protein [Halomonas hydrothermalis]BCB07912.1 hypothetical protein HHSLTHF2_18020 [Halomonas hydrothermalis]
MSHIVFKPWIGDNYSTSELGVRILILGESHYGDQGDEHEDFTIDVVKMWGKEKRLAFFTKIAKTILNYNASDFLSDNEKATLWENVAFYNYVQAIVGEGARVRPSDDMWAKSAPALQEVIEKLDPQVIIVLGKELADNLPHIFGEIEFCYLNHPSSGGYSYSENNKLVLSAIESVKLKDDFILQSLINEKKLEKIFTVAKVQRLLKWGSWRAGNVCSRAADRGVLSCHDEDGKLTYKYVDPELG